MKKAWALIYTTNLFLNSMTPEYPRTPTLVRESRDPEMSSLTSICNHCKLGRGSASILSLSLSLSLSSPPAPVSTEDRSGLGGSSDGQVGAVGVQSARVRDKRWLEFGWKLE